MDRSKWTDEQVKALLDGYKAVGIVWYAESGDLEGLASDGKTVCLNPKGCHSSNLYSYLRAFPTPDTW